METWPSLALRLLARVLQQGARFLERQGQQIEHWAEQVSGPEAGTSTGEDKPPSSSAERSQTGRSPGQPPAHWLEKVEASEGPVQWVEHAGAEPPEYLPHAAFPGSSRSRHEEREGSRYPAAGARSAGGDEHAHTGEATWQTASTSEEEPTRPRFEKPADGAGRRQAGRRRQRGSEEAGGEHASDSSASTSDSGGTPAARFRASQPARLEPTPARERSGQERETSDGSHESAEPTSSTRGEQTTPDTAQDPKRAASFQSRSGKSGISGAEPQSPSSRPASRKVPSDSTRRVATQPSTDRPIHSEHVAFGRRPASPTTPPRPSDAERSRRSPDSSAASEISYRSDVASSLPKQEEEIPTARSAHWPDLPDVDQIVREEVSASRRWERRMRNWERRRRLNREQRGQLWSA